MDLVAEFCAAQDQVEAKHIAWLKNQGVTKLGIFFEDSSAFAFGICPIEIQADDSWMPMPGGREAMILYAEDHNGVDDLLAFFPKSPANAFRRANALRYAGADDLQSARLFDQPLYLRSTLLDWMRWGRTGTVILDWEPASVLASDFGGVREVRADNAALGAKLRGVLMRPFPVPSILVPE